MLPTRNLCRSVTAHNKKAPRDAGGAQKVMMSCCPEELQEICSVLQSYWIVLATEENALLALLPTKRTVPTTSTKITASITAYRDVLTCFVSPQFQGEVEHYTPFLAGVFSVFRVSR